MKLTLNLTLIIVFCFSFFCFSQKKGIAFYKKTSTHNFDNVKGLSENQKAKFAFNSVNNSIELLEFVLMFNDSIAKYEKIDKIETEFQNKAFKLSNAFSGYNGPYHFNFKSGTVYRKKGKYLIKKKLLNFNWVLTKEMKKIGYLTCYKATTVLKVYGRRGEILKPVTAWYTTNINASAGPDGFGGLPGLIIQLEFDNVVTVLNKIEFKDEMKEIKFPKKGKIMTEVEFSNLIKDLVENRDKHYNKN